ncbi:cobalt-zinc-cadmium efflux system membrane fusion protein [Jejuia pallidilutea]|uniref:Cobalt-zinc-cadmium efflux system membrane fusion protein n=1 Tax=Jejuia pallidilutea TaxID=504487 RepID=A0A362X4A5_9FLAO|nr:efflux RND transporter periplasmic adaptor subunit [Jejuia pallidilutea]PQV49409.1 cobalt-zinc-cadmium efflux system membrane fusion protein [Jejuia pallidilutea]
MKQINFIITVSLFIAVFGCKNPESESNISADTITDNRISISKTQFKQNNMAMGSIEEKAFPITITVNGMIDVPPENKAIVNAITGGYIKTIPLLVGNKVKKGQLLVTIENPEFVKLQQEYMEVKEQLNYLKTEYERQNTMFKENIISQKVFIKAESTYKATNARYNGLKKQLSMLNINTSRVEQGHITSIVNIYAPVSGSITKVNVSKGAYVSPSTPILEIIDNSHIHLELSVFEKDIMRVKKGQNITFSIPEASNKIYNAKVYLVGTSIEDNRTIKVHAHPTDDSQKFLTGMFVNAEIISEESIAKALPETSFAENEEDTYALILDEETKDNYYFKQIKIAIGKTYNGYTEIKSTNQITKNDIFLVEGAFSLIGSYE